MDKLIIHISGASGSGKTTLGKKIKKKFGNKIIMMDLDNLRDKFIKKFYGDKSWDYLDEKEYQKFIDNYIKNQKKPIIFVGLNDNPMGKNKRFYYQIFPKYKFYIELDNKIILERKCLRFFKHINRDLTIQARDDMLNQNSRFLERLKKVLEHECSLEKTIKQNEIWEKDYKNQKYQFLEPDLIFEKVSGILERYFQKK